MTKVTIFNITWKRIVIELHLRDIAGNYKISRYQTRHQSTFQEEKKYHNESRDFHRHVETHIYSFRGTYKRRRGSTWPGWKGGRGRCDRSRVTEGATGNGTGSRVIQRGFTSVLVYTHRFTRRKCKEKNEGECRKRPERTSLPFLNSASFRTKWKVV